MKDFFKKYRELIIYIIVGGLTTVANYIIHFGLRFLGANYYISLSGAWLGAVFFAYVANRIFVFESKSWDLKLVAKEVSSFFAARVFSFLVEEAGLFLLVDICSMKDFAFEVYGFTISGNMISKVILAVVVVVMNYFFSKFVIFRKKDK